MSKFSAQELQQIAQSLNDMGGEVAQVRLDAIHSGKPLNDPQIVQLFGLNLSLLNLGSSFAAQAAEVALDDAEKALAIIKSATDQANKALDHLQLVDKAIDIASHAIVLANSIFTGNIEKIAESAKGVAESVNSLRLAGHGTDNPPPLRT